MFTKINVSSGQQWQGAEELLMSSRAKIAFSSWLHKACIKYVVKTQEDPQDSTSSTTGVQHCLAETGYFDIFFYCREKNKGKAKTQSSFPALGLLNIKHLFFRCRSSSRQQEFSIDLLFIQ